MFADEAVTRNLDARGGRPGVEVSTNSRYLTVTGHGSGTIAHERGLLAPFLKALDSHPSLSSQASTGTATAPRAAPAPSLATFTPEAAKALCKIDPSWNTEKPEVGAEIERREPTPLSTIASAVMHLAAARRMENEGDWKTVAIAIARIAYGRPPEAEAIRDTLDAASKVAGGHYDPEENRKHFDRFVREAASRPGYDDHTILRRAIEAGWRPPTPALVSSPTTAPAGSGPVGVADLPAVPPKRELLHGNDIVRCAVSLVVAPGGRGKSAWLIGTAMACATGRALMGSRIFAQPGGLRVLYINNEDGTDEIGRRVRAFMQHHRLSDTDCAGLKVAGVDRFRLTLLRAERGEASLDAQGWDLLEGLLQEGRPDVLILDPLANLSAASLNDNHAATMLLAKLTALAVQHRMGMVVAHHTAKGRDLASQEAASGAAADLPAQRSGAGGGALHAQPCRRSLPGPRRRARRWMPSSGRTRHCPHHGAHRTATPFLESPPPSHPICRRAACRKPRQRQGASSAGWCATSASRLHRSRCQSWAGEEHGAGLRRGRPSRDGAGCTGN
mgnify:CR=1 FL=1